MRVGLSQSMYRNRLQTPVSGKCKEHNVVSVTEKALKSVRYRLKR